MSDYVFKAYDDEGRDLSRYGFRASLTKSEITSLSSSLFNWWESPAERYPMERMNRVGEQLRLKWSREYGTDVKVHVMKAGSTEPILEV